MSGKILLISVISVLLTLGWEGVELAQADEGVWMVARAKKNKRRRKKKKPVEPSPNDLEDDPYGEQSGSAPPEEPTAPSDPVEPAPSKSVELANQLDEADKPISQATSEGTLRRSGRMEFDERLVKGQAAKSGAVYLFKRTPRRLPGLVPMRRSYRRRIVRPVLGNREIKPVVLHTQKESYEAPLDGPKAAKPKGGKKDPASDLELSPGSTEEKSQKRKNGKNKSDRKKRNGADN